MKRAALALVSLWFLSACDEETRPETRDTRGAAGVGVDEDAASGQPNARAQPDLLSDAAVPLIEAGTSSPSAGDSATANTSTDAASPSGAGKPCWKLPAIDRVRLYPAATNRSAVLQGKIEGSNTSAMNDFVELAQLTSLPAEGEWIELRIAGPAAYRYVKYYAPRASYGAIAEIEFYAGEQRVRGKAFGSAGSRTDGSVFERALDADPATVFEGPLPDDNYVGFDLAADHMLAAPTFSVGGGSYAAAFAARIEAAAGAQIFFTTDGRDPRVAGIPYTEPIKVEVGGTLLRAVATQPCQQPSEVSQVLYQVGGSARGAQASLHIGNSLTDTIVEGMQSVARSGGITLDFNRYTVPGAGTWLYERSPSGGFGVPDVRAALRTRRFDHVSMQPFPNMPCQVKASSDGEDSDSGFIQQAWTDARGQNPSVQLWVYQQWPAPQEFSNCLSGGGWTRGGWQPSAPKSWEEAVRNELSYQEAVRAELVRLNPSAPPPYIVPAGNALVALKRQIEADKVPGLNNFFTQIFAANGTDIHLTKPGAYLVTLVFYACMFQKSPEGGVADASLGVSPELAKALQRIAWESVTGYALSGVSR